MPNMDTLHIVSFLWTPKRARIEVRATTCCSTAEDAEPCFARIGLGLEASREAGGLHTRCAHQLCPGSCCSVRAICLRLRPDPSFDNARLMLFPGFLDLRKQMRKSLTVSLKRVGWDY